MLWIEKYQPKTIDEVEGNNKEKAIIKKWVSEWKVGNPQKPLLLVGPAGIGKTTLAHTIAREFSEFIELNASDKRSEDIIMSTVGESSSTHSLFGENYKLIILDEVDGIHGTNDRGGVKAINKIIDNTKHPLIMNANDFYSKRLAKIKTKCQIIKMKKIRQPTIKKVLKRIAEEEKIKINPTALKKLSKQADGDMRFALNTFQAIADLLNPKPEFEAASKTASAIADSERTLEIEDVERISKKDDRSTIINAVSRVLKSKNPEHIKKALIVEEDPILIMEYIAENIPREYERKNEIKAAYDKISKADIFFGRTLQSRNYGYWKYASDFMGLGVALSKKETYKKFTPIQSPKIFRLMRQTKGKRNLRDNIAEKMHEKMHISNSIAISMFPYLKIMFKDDELAWEIADFLELDDKEIKRFRSKKIPAKVIKKKEEEKKEKVVEEIKAWKVEQKEKIHEKPIIEEENKTTIEGEIEEEKPKEKTKQMSLFNF